MAIHNTTGKKGEQLAVEYLITAGYTIRETNWKSGRLELDIVAQKDSLLIIVEVKTRNNVLYEHPEDAVTEQKIKKIIAATEAYIRMYDIPLEVRFDIISVVNIGSQPVIDHIQDAFYPPLKK